MSDAAREYLIRHLRDTHALEEQSLRQLERAKELAADPEMKKLYEEHFEQTQEQKSKINERIESYDLKPSAVADLTMRAGEIGLRQLAEVQPDTPVKLAMHFFAFENLEVAAYEMLGRIAKEADDQETAGLAEEILGQEREMAEKIEQTFDRSAELLFEQDPSGVKEEDSDEEGSGSGQPRKDHSSDESPDTRGAHEEPQPEGKTDRESGGEAGSQEKRSDTASVEA